MGVSDQGYCLGCRVEKIEHSTNPTGSSVSNCLATMPNRPPPDSTRHRPLQTRASHERRAAHHSTVAAARRPSYPTARSPARGAALQTAQGNVSCLAVTGPGGVVARVFVSYANTDRECAARLHPAGIHSGCMGRPPGPHPRGQRDSTEGRADTDQHVCCHLTAPRPPRGATDTGMSQSRVGKGSIANPLVDHECDADQGCEE